jgi:dihydrofolate synthase/folylpolyglutamate synthase
LDRVGAALEARAGERLSVQRRPQLDRIRDLLHLLGDPQRAYPAIHVAGTNGKTSTTRMIDSLLRAFGLRTGCYTSPHLESVTERIVVDGAPLTPEAFAALYDEVAPLAQLVDDRHPDPVSYFELLTAMGFAAFADAPVGVACVEVGLGGRWDATNVLDAPVAVITPIGLDHMDILGDTVAAIAVEKAEIVHPGATLISARQPAPVDDVLAARSARVGGALRVEGQHFGVEHRSVAVGGQLLELRGLSGRYPDVFLPLHGGHQAGNAACALAAVESFLGGPLDLERVRTGFAAADSPGRLEVVRRNPTVLLDAAHNPAGAAALAEALTDSFQFAALHGVVAMLADKDAAGVLAALQSVLSDVTVSENGSSRAFRTNELAAVAAGVFGPARVRSAPELMDALRAALGSARADGGAVLVTGSVVTAGEARRMLRADL